MKKPASRIALIASAMAVACLLTVPAVHAADKDDAATKKAKKDADILKKYDKNGNGKLDPDEEAAMKADQAKAKSEKKKKEKENGSK